MKITHPTIKVTADNVTTKRQQGGIGDLVTSAFPNSTSTSLFSYTSSVLLHLLLLLTCLLLAYSTPCICIQTIPYFCSISPNIIHSIQRTPLSRHQHRSLSNTYHLPPTIYYLPTIIYHLIIYHFTVPATTSHLPPRHLSPQPHNLQSSPHHPHVKSGK